VLQPAQQLRRFERAQWQGQALPRKQRKKVLSSAHSQAEVGEVFKEETSGQFKMIDARICPRAKSKGAELKKRA
jgi:hypothetical protein